MKWLGWIIVVMGLLTGWQGFRAMNLEQGFDFSRGNAVYDNRQSIVIILSVKEGDIFNSVFFRILKQVTNDVFYIPGVDRPRLVSIMNSQLVSSKIFEDGFHSVSIVPEDFDVAQGDYQQIKSNIMKSPYYGILVSRDLKKTVIKVSALRTVDARKVIPRIQALLPQSIEVQAAIVGHAPLAENFKRAMSPTLVGMAIWAVVILLWSGWKLPAVDYPKFRKFNYIVVAGIILAGVFFAERQKIGFVNNLPIFSMRSQFAKTLTSSLDGFDFSSEQLLVLMAPRTGMYTDPQIIKEVNHFQWTLKGQPGVKDVVNLAQAVNYVNVVIHEGFFKWWGIPFEKSTLITVLACIDPHTGLLTDDGKNMPMRIFFNKHSAQDVERVIRLIQEQASQPNHALTIKLIGGTVLWAGIMNRGVQKLLPPLILIMLGFSVVFLAPVDFRGFSYNDLFVVLGSLCMVMAAMGVLKISIDFYIILGWVLGGLLLIGLTKFQRVRGTARLYYLLMGWTVVGAWSIIAFVQSISVIVLFMLLIWTLLRIIFPAEKDLEDRGVAI